MILSVMVISHNQAHLIRRCLDSILAQKITAPWEIVISDDASTDDTWDVIQEYVKQYPESKKKGENYVPRVRAYQINSSDYNPTVTSDRCAANKANVYMHAEGEYCVNIDADDYLLGDDIYQYQMNQLDSHPECSVAVQNIWLLKDGDPIEKAESWHGTHYWSENEVMSFDTYCNRRLFTSNPAIMMRRDPNLNPIERYGLLFDDPIISAHHMLKDKIICTRKTDYVYVQYKNSIWNGVDEMSGDRRVRVICPLMVYLKFYPEYVSMFMRIELISMIRGLKSYLQQKPVACTALTKAYVERLGSRTLNRMANGSAMVKWRLRCALYILLLNSRRERKRKPYLFTSLFVKLLS